MTMSEGEPNTKTARNGPRRRSILSTKRTEDSGQTAAATDIQPKKGVMFIEHLPYGMDEGALKVFFEQYGEVTNVYLPRSERSFRSKGYGYVEFKYEEVAKVAASSVDNHLLFGRKLKASAIPTRFKKVPVGNLDELKRHKEYLKWRNITDTNGFVGTKRLEARQARAAKKMEPTMKILNDAIIKSNKRKLNLQCFVIISVADQTAARNVLNQMAHETNANSTKHKSPPEINVKK